MVTLNRTSLILGYFAGLIALLAPLLAFIAPKGLAPLVIAGGLIGLGILKYQRRDIFGLPKPVIILFICLAVWSALSIFWAIDSRSAAIGVAKLIGNLGAGGILFAVLRSLSDAERRLALRGLFAGFIFILVLVPLEIYLGNPVYMTFKSQRFAPFLHESTYWLKSCVSLLAILIWPVGAALAKLAPAGRIKIAQLILVVLGFVAVLLLAIMIQYSSAIIALSFGLFGAGVIWLVGRRAVVVAAVVLVLIGLLLPSIFTKYGDPVVVLTTVISVPFSAQHRLKIWQFVAEKIEQKKLLGWGMNASKDMPGGNTKLISKSGQPYGAALPLHPHNAILQMWLELGLPGIILYLGLGVFILKLTASRYRLKFDAAMMMGQIVTILTIANLSFGIWQAWWLASIWLAGALMMLAVRKSRPV